MLTSILETGKNWALYVGENDPLALADLSPNSIDAVPALFKTSRKRFRDKLSFSIQQKLVVIDSISTLKSIFPFVRGLNFSPRRRKKIKDRQSEMLSEPEIPQAT